MAHTVCGKCKREKETDRYYCNKCANAAKRKSVNKKRNFIVDMLLEQQGYECALCNKDIDRTAHIDHDHDCCSRDNYCLKCIRGLLCPACNSMLGQYEKLIRLGKVDKINDYLRI